MKREKSCGAVVFTRKAGGIRYVLAANLAGVYGFPKGHVEAGEMERQTALREVKEETGLDVTLLDGFRTTDEYMIPETDILKHIVYFLGEYEDQQYTAQKKEISRIELCTFDEAMALFQHESSKRILKEADDFLRRSH